MTDKPQRAGNIDGVTDRSIDGWYINAAIVGASRIGLYVDQVLVGDCLATISRADVAAAGYDRNECGFHLPLPNAAIAARLVEIYDMGDGTLLWQVDLGRRLAVGFLNEAPVTGTHAEDTAEDDATADPLRVILDISDLVFYLGHHDTLTGIQRVQSCIIQAVIKYKMLKPSHFGFVAFDRMVGGFRVVDERSFLKLLSDLAKPVTERSVVFNRDKAKIGQLFSRGPIAIDPRTGPNTVLVLLGAAWVIPDYVHAVLTLKRRFGIRFALTFHDLIPIYARETCDQGTAEVFRVFLDQIVRHVEMGLCVSKNTARDLIRYCEENALPAPPTLVTRNGSSFGEFFPSARTGLDPLPLVSSDPYVLFVSTIEGRKNHLYAFQIWEQLIRSGVAVPRLICVGRLGWRSEDFLQALLRTNNLNGRISVVEDISDQELELLYRNAQFTIYPSLYEGWGLPVGESLAYGKPCVLTEVSSLPEVAGEFGIYIPLNDVEIAAETIRVLVEDPAQLQREAARVAAGFQPITWETVAGQILAGCRLALQHPPRAAVPLWQLGQEYPIRHPRTQTQGLMGQKMFDELMRQNRRVLLSGMASTAQKLLGIEARNGEFWYEPELWGCWTRGKRAEMLIAIDTTDLAPDENILLYAAVQVPGQYVPCRIGVTIAGQRMTDQMVVRPDNVYCWAIPARVVQAAGTVLESASTTGASETGLVGFEIGLVGVSEESILALRQLDSRDIGIGLKSLALIREGDTQRRLDVLERQVFANG